MQLKTLMMSVEYVLLTLTLYVPVFILVGFITSYWPVSLVYLMSDYFYASLSFPAPLFFSLFGFGEFENLSPFFVTLFFVLGVVAVSAWLAFTLMRSRIQTCGTSYMFAFLSSVLLFFVAPFMSYPSIMLELMHPENSTLLIFVSPLFVYPLAITGAYVLISFLNRAYVEHRQPITQDPKRRVLTGRSLLVVLCLWVAVILGNSVLTPTFTYEHIKQSPLEYVAAFIKRPVFYVFFNPEPEDFVEYTLECTVDSDCVSEIVGCSNCDSQSISVLQSKVYEFTMTHDRMCTGAPEKFCSITGFPSPRPPSACVENKCVIKRGVSLYP